MLSFLLRTLILQKLGFTYNQTESENIISEIPNARNNHAGHGSCAEGTMYQIRNIEDLKTLYADQLECIYFAAVPPSKVPEGRLPLTVFSVLDNRLAATVFDEIFKAKFIFKVICKKDKVTKTYFMGLNITPMGFKFPSVASLMDTTVQVAPGEHTEKLPFLAIDYSANFRELCDDRNPLKDIPNLHNHGNAFPVTNVFDTVRLVGRDEDGAAILLGKAYFKLGIFEGFYTTAVYFALTSLDSKLNPEFAKGDALPPLKQGFSYRIPSIA